jgi:CheY-like chemotaxis protein
VKTILVVDDDPVSVRLIEMILGRHGYACQPAASAAEALAWLDLGRPVEMVITDQNLGGMSGLELSEKIRADGRFHGLQVILCTGVADRATVEAAMRLGIRHFVVKPIAAHVLMAKVEAVAAERPRVMDSRGVTMTRLQLTDAEYKALVQLSLRHLTALGVELARAEKGGDRVTTVTIAGRLREPASMLTAVRLIDAVGRLEGTRTWRDFEDAVTLVFEELRALENALDTETKPQLIGRPMGYPGPDAY